MERQFSEAAARGSPHVEVKAGELHRSLGGYPGHNHRMPVCCSVMRALMSAGDEQIAAPPKGDGASLVIKYFLPRTKGSEAF